MLLFFSVMRQLFLPTLRCRSHHCTTALNPCPLHASLVHIEYPIGSHAEPAMLVSFCWRSAPGRVKVIAKVNIATDWQVFVLKLDVEAS